MSVLEETKVKLIEVFNTWQGEGPDSGKSMLILRFKTCNMNCPWCDTKVKMRITPEAEYPLMQLQEIIDEHGCGILVTGGEPTVDKHFEDCKNILNHLNYPIANVESNGYRLVEMIRETDQSPRMVNYIFSPKIFRADHLAFAKQTVDEIFNTGMTRSAYIKVVYELGNRYQEEFLEWLSEDHWEINQHVYLMPEGVTRAALIQNSGTVFDACEKYKFNFSSRDHIIYGFI